ncbi:hypothetical protein E2542_SST27059 [Spatholobus suberectus]|nr:hypothetical protein E2542_SST27059 [Spatholobus suberectus]
MKFIEPPTLFAVDRQLHANMLLTFRSPASTRCCGMLAVFDSWVQRRMILLRSGGDKHGKKSK